MVIESERRPNLLVVCDGDDADDVLRQLRLMCAAPVHSCRLPGTPALPSDAAGTLLLYDVAALTISQQVMLFDWLQHRRGDMQVLSVTGKRLGNMVREGRFLEALFYRLNLISVTAQRKAQIPHRPIVASRPKPTLVGESSVLVKDGRSA